VVAVSLFHTQSLVHHDLKPDNIFIDEDLNAIVGVWWLCYLYLFALGDFGETRSFMVNHTSTVTALGTMLYMAPEIVKGEKLVNLFYNFFFFYIYIHFLVIYGRWELLCIMFLIF
jgi:serine/threonine protein kinase